MNIGLFSLSDLLSRLSLSFVSGFFLVFLLILLLFYFMTRKEHRWIVLLIGSLLFLVLGGGMFVASVPIFTTLVAFFAAKTIEDTPKDQKKRFGKLVLSSSVIVLVSGLLLVKLTSFFQWGSIRFVFPIGISYYTFSLISYLADVYWARDRAEQHFFKLLLFTVYFPKILQGPISRHRNLASQLIEGHSFSEKNLRYGSQLMVWGYFKKTVIADRIGILVQTVMSDHSHYGGAILFLTMVLSSIQLYCDFSACMDIASGVSEILGISLEKNFNHPFVSKSAAEFWRRFHITLGTFFKDYVYMPLFSSPRLVKFVQVSKKRFGEKIAKNLWTIIPTAVVWLMTGLWHGTGINYILWGVYWGTVIIVSMLGAEKFRRAAEALHINTDKASWQAFRMIRTFMLYLIGRTISMPSNLAVTGDLFAAPFTRMNVWELFDGTLFKLGLDRTNMLIVFASLLGLFLVEHYQQKYSVREKIAEWNVLIRSLFYSLAIVAVVVFGIWGPALMLPVLHI